ncbi:MAG: transposase [Polyangiaceae bacterium]|nr:transposase [Polyangiaceae bacterium]
MATEEAKRKYRARPGLCELPNAPLKCHHGMAQVRVRGIAKVTCVVVLGPFRLRGRRLTPDN